MEHIISFEHSKVIWFKGTFRKNKVVVSGYDSEPVRRNLSENEKTAGLKEALSALGKRNKLHGKTVTLILSGRSSLYREITVPQGRTKKQERKIVMNELMLDNTGVGEYVSDYAVLERDDQKKTCRCIVNAILKDTIRDGISVLAESGIKCKSIQTRPNCKTKLVRLKYPKPDGMISVEIYGMYIVMELIGGGQCILSRSMSLSYKNFEKNPEVLVSEMADQINKMIQFNSARHLSGNVKLVLISGTYPDIQKLSADLGQAMEEIRPGELNCIQFDPEEYIREKKALKEKDYVGSAGALIPQKNDYDFYEIYLQRIKKARTVKSVPMVTAASVLGVGIIAVAGVSVKAEMDADHLNMQTAVIQDYVANSEDAKEYERLLGVQSECKALKAKNDLYSKKVAVVRERPLFMRKTYDALISPAPSDMELQQMSYTDDGFLGANFICRSAKEVPDYIEKVRGKEVFLGAGYTEWKAAEGYQFQASCLVRTESGDGRLVESPDNSTAKTQTGSAPEAITASETKPDETTAAGSAAAESGAAR